MTHHRTTTQRPGQLSLKLRTICAAGLLMATAVAATAQTTAVLEKQGHGPVTAGVVERTFTPAGQREWRGQTAHQLHVVVWYPAVSGATEVGQFIGEPGKPLFDAGIAAPKAPLMAASATLAHVPLIVLSHGSGGAAIQLAWLGTALARAGFIAAAVDHPGNNNMDMTPAGTLLWWERATDVTDVIDGMLADPEFGPRVDRTKIGIAGYSLGGYTSLELVGARTDFSRMEDLCNAKPETPICNTPAARRFGSSEALLAAVRQSSPVSLARSAESFADPRITAAFVMAPAPAFVLTQDSLRTIHVPVEIVVGKSDKLAMPAQNADYVRANVHAAREITLPGNAGHYVFLDNCTDRGRHEYERYCTDGDGVSRERIHADVGVMAISFFDHALRVK